MKKVKREELLPLAECEQQRETLRREAMQVKDARRVHLGQYLTLLFENAATVRYQVQEMLRLEKRASEADIEHELDTYNELLGGAGELGCTLLIEVEDPLQRDILLRKWKALPGHLYLSLENGKRARARFDPFQVAEDKLSAVQFLRFDCRGVPPVGLGLDLPGLELEIELSAEQRAALRADLQSDA